MPSDHPVYPTWVRPARVRQFWTLTAAVVVAAVVVGLVWPPALALAVLAAPFAYIAVVITVASRRLSPHGGDLQRTVHGLLADAVGPGGRLLWQYSQAQAERNARLGGVTGLELVRGSASDLPFSRRPTSRGRRRSRGSTSRAG